MGRASVCVVLCASACVLGGCGGRGGLDLTSATVGAGGTPAESGGSSGGVTATGGAAGAVGGGGSWSTLCDAPLRNRAWLESLEAVLAAMQGTWARCGHPLTDDESEVGLQIAADRRYSILVSGLDGTPVPSTSLFGRGTVVVTPLAPYNGHFTYDVDFASDANLSYQTRPFFTDNVPRQMVTTNTDIIWQRYVLAGP
jgi:hypothetical protein